MVNKNIIIFVCHITPDDFDIKQKDNGVVSTNKLKFISYNKSLAS